jgi:chromosome segregation ATPase
MSKKIHLSNKGQTAIIDLDRYDKLKAYEEALEHGKVLRIYRPRPNKNQVEISYHLYDENEVIDELTKKCNDLNKELEELRTENKKINNERDTLDIMYRNLSTIQEILINSIKSVSDDLSSLGSSIPEKRSTKKIKTQILLCNNDLDDAINDVEFRSYLDDDIDSVEFGME